MALQERPVCFFLGCVEPIEHDAVYEAPCGHPECPSAVFHPLCLMKWREHREHLEREIRRFVEQHSLPGEDGDDAQSA